MSERDAPGTREKLLMAAFEEIHLHGFQGLRIDRLLEKTGLTKGAFYHHFKSKKALGYAVVDEVIARMIHDLWLEPLQQSADPIDTIGTALSRKTDILGEDFVVLGCPLNNLAQEMSPVDEGFRQKLQTIFEGWVREIGAALAEGQKQGIIRSDIDPAEAALFVVASFEGAFSLAKNAQSVRALEIGERQLLRYLETLRP